MTNIRTIQLEQKLMETNINHKRMIVMPSSNTGFECGRLFGAFPNRMAHLIGADDKRNPPTHKYAIDNGIFGATKNQRNWTPEPFFGLLETIAQWKKPMWVVVPDAIGDKEETLRRWEKYSHTCRLFDVPLAFAAQDGMTPDDIPKDAEVVFIGGSTEWKWRNLRIFTESHPRVHVGRVNTYRLLWMAHNAGAESCDGTGWFQGDQKQIAGLWRYLEESESGICPQMDFFDDDEKNFSNEQNSNSLGFLASLANTNNNNSIKGNEYIQD